MPPVRNESGSCWAGTRCSGTTRLATSVRPSRSDGPLSPSSKRDTYRPLRSPKRGFRTVQRLTLGTRAPDFALQLAHEGDKGRLLPRGQLHAQHEVEKLHRILQRQEAPIVHVWRGVLDPAQGEGLDGAVGVDPLIVDRARLVEALDPQIVHLVVEVRRGRMTRCTEHLAE